MPKEMRLVKNLFVDESGCLVAETWSGVIALGIPMSLLGKPGGVAKLNGDGKLTVEEHAPFLSEMDHLPPPGPDYVGNLIRVKLPSEEIPSGMKTEVYACVVNSQDQYQWVKLSEST
ncbi:hypothetical protein LCGC14_2309150 [marine sediment metagenome]|uniref:Uncharacterized protein n=1 Tax=marine sediment metagenome TaxID=412755 RepID=A0A0F9CL58_9ZZZZ